MTDFRIRMIFAIAAFGFFIAATTVLAHHGTAAFDTSKETTFKATVTEVQFSNPHVILLFDVKNEKGEIEAWQGELTAPTKLTRAGWSKSTLKAGDTITVGGFAVKSGSHTMWIRKLLGPDGQPLPLSEN